MALSTAGPRIARICYSALVKPYTPFLNPNLVVPSLPRRPRCVRTMATDMKPAQLPNSLEYTLPTRRGDYLIQVWWPLPWGEDRAPKEDAEDEPEASTIYVLDGNAYAATANDVARRMEFTDKGRTMIVGIGYPVTDSSYDMYRRSADMTPASRDGTYSIPWNKDGFNDGIAYGGGADFLDILLQDIVPHVEGVLFPKVAFRTERKMLYGHSYGALLALQALFTRPGAFGTYVAASPALWFNDCAIVREQEADFAAAAAARAAHPGPAPPKLYVFWGSEEQSLVRYPDESDEYYAVKADIATSRRIRDHAVDMVARLGESPGLRSVFSWEYEGEDHGGAATCSIQRSVFKFLKEKETR